jgi:hypothetical protein
MSGELLLPPTGNEIVDSLRGLQMVADSIDDRDAKVAHVKKTLQFIDAWQLLGKQMMVSSLMTFGKNPDQGDDIRTFFKDEMLFLGQLNTMTYMLDDNIPVDSLALAFDLPEVIGVAPEECERFRVLRLQVPILAIETCVLAEVA